MMTDARDWHPQFIKINEWLENGFRFRGGNPCRFRKMAVFPVSIMGFFSALTSAVSTISLPGMLSLISALAFLNVTGKFVVFEGVSSTRKSALTPAGFVWHRALFW